MPKVKPYSLKDAQLLVDDAIKRSEGRHSRWRKLEGLYRTGQAGGDVASAAARLHDDLPGLSLDAINMVLPHMTIIIASSVDRAPEFIAEPYGMAVADEGARHAEELLRYFWKRVHGTEIARDMVQDMVVIGNGFAKTGWVFEENESPRPDDEIVEELADLFEQDRKDVLLSADPETGEPTKEPTPEDELLALVDSVQAEIVDDEPWLQYVSPYDIFVPATARRIDEARWICHRMVLPIDEVKANPAFSHTDELVATSKEDRAERRGMDEDVAEGVEDDPFAEVTLYEFYDMRARRLLVFQADSSQPLYDDDLPYSHRYSPFVHMRNFEDGGSRFWAFGDLENVAALQVEYNDYVVEQMGNARRAGNKYVVSKDVWDDGLKGALESEQADVVFPIDTKGGPVGDVIQALERKGLSADVYAAKNDVLQAIADVLGLNDFQMGGMGADRMSATAAAVVDGTATLRSADKRRQVEAGVGRIGLLLLLLCQEYLEIPQALRIVKGSGEVEWLEVDADTIVGEFDVNVSTGSTQAVNPATRQQRAVEMMTSILPALAADGYDTHPIWRQALKEYGVDPDRLLHKLPLPPELAPPGAAAMAGQGAAPAQAPGGMEPAQRADVEPQTAGEVAI